jgi:hypothetical protein
VDEEVEDLAGIEVRQRLVGMVLRELGGPAEVGSDGSLAEAFEVDEAGVILIPPCGGEVPAN